MKRIKKTLSIVLAMIVLILAIAVIAPANARQKDISSTGGWPDKITFDAGAAFKEDVSWYVWTWSWDEEFEDGKWIRGKTEDCKTVYFSGHGPNVVFACMEGDVSDPDWDKVVLQSPEMEVEGFYYTVTDVDRKKLDGEWSWDAPSGPTDPTDSEQPSDSVTHEAFAILNPISTGTYYVNEEIEVQVGCARYYYSYSANGSRLNTPNTVVLEFNKNNRVVHTSIIQFHADDLGYYLTDEFTPTSAGTYIVRVGYSKSSVTSVSNSNYVGSYSFEVLSNEEPTEPPTEAPTDPPTEKPTESVGFSHPAIKMITPVEGGVYPVNERIDIQLQSNPIYYYTENGSRKFYKHCYVIEISKGNQVIITASCSHWHVDGASGILNPDWFRPTQAGIYTVRLGFATIKRDSGESNPKNITDENYVGSYTFTVKGDDTPTEPSTDTPAEIIRGDVDGDGEVTIIDATAIQRHLADLPTESYNETAADCDGDGYVTILDATAIQRFLADLPTEAEGIGEPIK